MTPQQVAEASAQALWANDRASRDLGITLVAVAPGSAVLSMTITERMTNGHGSAHGGYLFMLADSAFAFACNTYNQITVAQHCAITYIAPGAPGDLLTARAQEVSRTGRSGLYTIAITREDGTLIATFQGHSRTLSGTLFAA